MIRIALVLFVSLQPAAALAGQRQLPTSTLPSSQKEGDWANEDGTTLPMPAQSTLATRSPLEGRIADSTVGEVGQRRTRDTASANGSDPTARLNNRIQNRVQSRIGNRIDRYYNAQANAASPFEAAGEQAQGRRRPSAR